MMEGHWDASTYPHLRCQLWMTSNFIVPDPGSSAYTSLPTRSSLDQRVADLEAANKAFESRIVALESTPAIAELDAEEVARLERLAAPVDTDNDSVPDMYDVCPSEAGVNYQLVTLGGIPQAKQLIDQIEVPFYGCPDDDSDFIPDAVDLCPEAISDNDENLDGCEDTLQDFSTSGGDHRWVTTIPAYDDASGKLVGRFQAERTVAGVVVEFLIACEAMGEDGIQLSGTTKDHSLVKSWGACRPVGGP